MALARRLGLTAACMVSILALAACGGSSDSGEEQVASLDDGSTQPAPSTTSTSSSGDSPQDILVEFTGCMRDQGVDVPDPTFDENGQPQFQPGGAGAIDPQDPNVQAAFEACQPILEGIQNQFTPEAQEALQEAALEYAACMRENGVDVPDPDFSGGGGGGPGGPFGNVDQDDPDFEAANEICQAAFEGIEGPFGGGNEG